MPKSKLVDRKSTAAAGKAEFTLADIVELLRRGGSRVTPNRQAIIEVMLAARNPLSLEDIQKAARERMSDGSTPDFATVFRMMALLEELQLARKVHLGRATSHYELTDSQHHRDHLICTDCGEVTPLEGSCPVEQLERQIADKHRFTQLTHSLEFFGRCEDCSTRTSPADARK